MSKMSEYIFDFDAGNLCLDFANTSNWHASEHPEESLRNFSDLLAWGLAAGVLPNETAKRLSRLAIKYPELTQQAYLSAIQVREAIYHIFSDRYNGKPISSNDLALLNALVQEATTHRHLVSKEDTFQWEWKPEGEGSEIILWEVAFAAAQLLTSEKVVWVRECEDDRGCGYLFMDVSKNHSRRWCSMESCGNRAKARRHYSRSISVTE
jgi:predicted RNA-binding Zn ribbon-like protein